MSRSTRGCTADRPPSSLASSSVSPGGIWHHRQSPHITLSTCRRFSTSRIVEAAQASLTWPTARRPTPHQIFHFAPGSHPSQAEIKQRYYQLVREHHPDKSSLPAPQAQGRFQAISDAYEVLRNPRSAQSRNWRHARPLTPDELAALERRRAYHQAQRAHHMSSDGGPMESGPRSTEPATAKLWMVWAEGVALSVGTLLFFVFAFPYGVLRHHSMAAELEFTKSESARMALEAAEDARREHGANRREELRVMLERIQARNEAQAQLSRDHILGVSPAFEPTVVTLPPQPGSPPADSSGRKPAPTTDDSRLAANPTK
ncbi:hypothetical protein BKA62DRAFT_674182 [Auriculariales sp. MPI-PUGE-AT-0066]|nr:hypothetical protein BKA62DRAFT_674182 [Auriculariales sp. MPI-PUGE-AT-0066]